MARRYFYPGCHRMEPYRSMPQYRDLGLPATDALTSRVLCLPTGTAVDVDAIEAVCDVIATAVRHGAEIARRLHDHPSGAPPWATAQPAPAPHRPAPESTLTSSDS